MAKEEEEDGEGGRTWNKSLAQSVAPMKEY